MRVFEDRSPFCLLEIPFVKLLQAVLMFTCMDDYIVRVQILRQDVYVRLYVLYCYVYY